MNEKTCENAGKKDKEAEIMPTAVKLIDDEQSFVRDMNSYLNKLVEQSKSSKESAVKDAKKALTKTGVINNNGTAKKKIVSWE